MPAQNHSFPLPLQLLLRCSMTILPATIKIGKLVATKFPLRSDEWNLLNIKHQAHFNQILSHAIISGLFTDPSISSKLLLHSFSITKSLSFPRSLFFQMQNPNVFAYNFMFKSYSKSSNPIDSITLYNSMRKIGTLPDNYTFPLIFKACGRLLLLSKGQELHLLSIVLGLEDDVFVQNGLISMYSSCGAIKIASKVFGMVQSSVRDVVTWNSMLSGYLNCHCNVDALKVFGDLSRDDHVRFDGMSLISVASACGRIGLADKGKEVHCVILRNGFVLDEYLGSSLIDMYAKCGHMWDARKVFDRIPERNLVCWTSMIVGFTRLDMFKQAIGLFKEMQLYGVTADSALIAAVISACGHMGALDEGRWVHNYCEMSGTEMNLSVRNALIDMYSKCGDVEKALQIFKELNKKDVFSWTSMISGLAMSGNCEKALYLFDQMEMSGDVRPNEVTFLGVLSACSHGGFVSRGLHCFRAMSQIYHLTPRIEHYGCMVDLLGRANLIAEAEEFVRAMPIEPDVIIWRSLLFACRNHGNIDLAEIVNTKIEALEPQKSQARVLLSNVYASSSRWGDVRKVRNLMAHQKIQKQPGCSSVEINGLVHEFLTYDGSHDQADVIHETNMRIHKVLLTEGFNSDNLDYQLQ